MEGEDITIGYWQIRGVIEPIKTLMEHLKVPYQMKYYHFGDPPNFDKSQWHKEKQKLDLEFPNLPYLIDGEFKISQPLAIMKYICCKFSPNLMGEGVLEKSKIEMVVQEL